MKQTLKATEALDKIKKGEAVLIDVREPDEFKAEHITYALSIPLGSLEGGFQELDIPKSKAIIFQCRTGSRGQVACQRMHDLCVCENSVMNIEGGIEAWKKANLPMIGAASAPLKISIMRQVQIIVGLLIALCTLLGFSGMPLAFILAGAFGAALFFAGVTGWCGLGILLLKMPWNK